MQIAGVGGGRPNVVFILADDLGYGDFGLFGNTIVRTPHLDALGREGTVLTDHYSASPLCAPARAALLTGRYNHRTGAVDVPSNRGLDRIALDERTIADVFAHAGYSTGMVGKWHNGLHDLRYHPLARGFDEFVGFLNGGMDYYRWVIDRNRSPEVSDGRYLTDVFTDEAVQFIRRHRAERFFLYLSYNAPHLPYQAPESLIAAYGDTEGLTEDVRTIYAMIESMDSGIGRVLEELIRCGIDRNTIVVFTSDNGPWLAGDSNRFNGPLRGAKGDVLEGGIRVPALIRWPDGLPQATTRPEMIHFCDWLPTLASLAGVNPHIGKPLDGQDVSGALLGRAGTIGSTRFWQRNRYEPVPRCNGAMREGPWKLVWPMLEGGEWKDPSDSEYYRAGLASAHRIMEVQRSLPARAMAQAASSPELYRIDRDPHEDADLSAEFPHRVDSMAREWDRWFAAVMAEWRPAYHENTSA
jgi:arylsulfatase A-like enzyme